MVFKLYRGIAIAPQDLPRLEKELAEEGLRWSKSSSWSTQVCDLRGRLAELTADPTLSTQATRRTEKQREFLCACGDWDGAAYYATRHNVTKDHTSSLILSFEAPASEVIVDGKDLLYTLFQAGPSPARRKAVASAYGTRAIEYLERAWQSEDQNYRIAMCDVACQDAAVVRAHYRNRLVLAGRHETRFRSAFCVLTPFPTAVVKIETLDRSVELPAVQINLRDLFLHGGDPPHGGVR